MVKIFFGIFQTAKGPHPRNVFCVTSIWKKFVRHIWVYQTPTSLGTQRNLPHLFFFKYRYVKKIDFFDLFGILKWLLSNLEFFFSEILGNHKKLVGEKDFQIFRGLTATQSAILMITNQNNSKKHNVQNVKFFLKNWKKVKKRTSTILGPRL